MAFLSRGREKACRQKPERKKESRPPEKKEKTENRQPKGGMGQPDKQREALGALGVQSVTSHPGPGSSEAHPAGRMIGIGLRAREPYRPGGARSQGHNTGLRGIVPCTGFPLNCRTHPLLGAASNTRKNTLQGLAPRTRFPLNCRTRPLLAVLIF